MLRIIEGGFASVAYEEFKREIAELVEKNDALTGKKERKNGVDGIENVTDKLKEVVKLFLCIVYTIFFIYFRKPFYTLGRTDITPGHFFEFSLNSCFCFKSITCVLVSCSLKPSCELRILT